MAMYRKHPDIPVTVTIEDVQAAICQDPNQCTFACSAVKMIGPKFGERAAETLNVDYEVADSLTEDDHVLVVWDGEDGYHYDGIIRGSLARRVVFLTDKHKRALIRDIRKNAPDGLDFKIENVRSRLKQAPDGERPPPDMSTLRYARDVGYRHGRAKQPATAKSRFIVGEVYDVFSANQREEYEEGYKLGLAKGPSIKRKPRRSAANKGRFGILPAE